MTIPFLGRNQVEIPCFSSLVHPYGRGNPITLYIDSNVIFDGEEVNPNFSEFAHW